MDNKRKAWEQGCCQKRWIKTQHINKKGLNVEEIYLIVILFFSIFIGGLAYIFYIFLNLLSE